MQITTNYNMPSSYKMTSNSTRPVNTNLQTKNIDTVSFKGNKIGELIDFVNKHSKIIPAEKAGSNDINLTFFGVRKIGEPSVEKFKELASPIKEILNKTKEDVSYIKLGPIFDSQEKALQTMGLGHLMGEWEVLSPDTLMEFAPKGFKNHLAGQGLVTIKNK